MQQLGKRVLGFLTLFFAFGVYLQAEVAPPPAQGSHVMLVSETPLVVAGKILRAAPAGERFEVVATNSGQNQVFVSVAGADGKKGVAALPLANVVAVDASAPATAATPAPPSAQQAAAPQPDAQGAYSALDVARFFKADRPAATAQFSGKPLKIQGTVERASTQVGSDGPIVIFATEPGLPKIKALVQPSVSGDREFYKSAVLRNWYYDGWYGSGHKLEFRPAGNGLDARFRYKRTTSSSSGSSTFKSWSDWFPIFTPGDVLTANGTCKGLMMDVIIEAAEIGRPETR